MNRKCGQNLRSFFPILLVWLLAAATIQAERLPIKIYTSADGLGSGFVDSIFRDSRGFMWFATRDGLSRFDGSRFVNYQVGDKGTSPGVENIYETRDGIYWISTTGGSYKFNPNQISQNDAANPKLNAEFITDARGQFLEDSKGNFWLGSNSLFQIEQADSKIVFKKVDLNLPTKPNTTFVIADIAEAADGSLWINTSWGLVRRLPDTRLVFYSYETPIPQEDTSTCWVAAYQMMFNWKKKPIDTIPVLVKSAGINVEKSYEKGIDKPDWDKAGKAFGLTTVTASTSFSASELAGYLSKSPVLVHGLFPLGMHTIVIVGCTIAESSGDMEMINYINPYWTVLKEEVVQRTSVFKSYLKPALDKVNGTAGAIQYW